MHTSTRLHLDIRALLGLLLTLALAPLLGLAPAPAQAASGDCVTASGMVTCTFDYTGAAQTWSVPAGVTSAAFDLYGAAATYTGNGGNGGRVRATLDVVPGTTYQILVGGSNGFNGGGRGGSPTSYPFGGSSGGGASDVRLSPYTLAERLLVAGGGGGTRGSSGYGGAGGYPAGTSTGGGAGGSQTAGGAGASGAGAGSLGQGGAGADASGYDIYAGGGGGGGYYGGGGGGACEFGCSGNGGGGGSSYATPAATSVGFETGVRPDNGSIFGNGQVVVSYAEPDSSAPVLTPDIAGTLGGGGWYTSDVSVSWSVSDAESTIISQSGCDAQSVTSDTSGTEITCSATSVGGTASQSVTIKRDATAPTTSGSSSIAGTQATVTLTASDNLSGIATTSYSVNGGALQSYTGPFALSGPGTYTISYSSADVAGNTEVTRTLDVNVVVTFPANGVLDSFNRANGKVGDNWEGLTSTSFYKLAANKLDAQLGGPLVWKATSFGTTQEAFVTLNRIDRRSRSQGLLLKVQTGNSPNAGAISVVYDAKSKAVRVSTLRLGQNGAWTLYPSQPATFENGDVLGARANADGTVQIYQNGTLVATVTLNAADQEFFNTRGGKIGIWTAAAPNALLDDFGGGAVAP
jgi:hypothetical protein